MNESYTRPEQRTERFGGDSTHRRDSRVPMAMAPPRLFTDSGIESPLRLSVPLRRTREVVGW